MKSKILRLFTTLILTISVFSMAYKNWQINKASKNLSTNSETATNVLAEKNEEVNTTVTVVPSLTLSPSPTRIPRKIKIGVVVADHSNKTGDLTGAEKDFLGKIATVGIYKQFGLPTNKFLEPNELTYIKSKGYKLLITWEPWDPRQGMNQSIDYLKEINEGKLDSYITEFANQIKSFGGLVYLRFGHEMNGNWYPWGNRAETFVAAYKRVTDLVRSTGANNVKYVWGINANSVPEEPITESKKYYPGNGYVDFAAVDGFDFNGDRTFAQIFLSPYRFLSTTFPTKPIIIGEVAASEAGGKKGKWIDAMFASLYTMPRITEIIWFNLNKEADWRVNSSTTSLEAFQRNLRSI